MMNAVAVADLHGNRKLYELLLRIAASWRISSIFIAGDLAPASLEPVTLSEEATLAGVEVQRAFLSEILIPMFDSFLSLHRSKHIYAIQGNDDRRANEDLLLDFSEACRNFHLLNDRMVEFRDSRRIRAFFPGEVPQLFVAGYPYVPVGATFLMDWVKHENDVGLVPPGMDPCMDLDSWGFRTVTPRFDSTIQQDLESFSAYLAQWGRSECTDYDPGRTIHMFHAPPHGTALDRTAPRGRYEFLPLPEHIGSTEIRRFIEAAQPHLVLCGHCHEAVVLGDYREDLGITRCVNPGSQTHIDVLSLIQFDPYDPAQMKQLFVNAK